MRHSLLLIFALVGIACASGTPTTVAAADDLQTQSPTTTVQSFTAVEGADFMGRLDAAQARARAYREVRARFAASTDALIEDARREFGIETPFGGPTVAGLLTLHCPPDKVYALTSYLRENGAEAVAVADLDYVFSKDNPLYGKLEAAL